MDPVNPAPAGNPQLTTHLLVSHKKNKNFHPSKVSLKRVNIVTTQMPLLCRPVPHAIRFIHSGIRRWTRSAGSFKAVELFAKCLDRHIWLEFGVTDQPCTIHLEFRWSELMANEEDDVSYTFEQLTLVLKVLDWDERELLHLTESNYCQESLQEMFGDWFNGYRRTALLTANSFIVRLSWNQMFIQIGDSQAHVIRDDQSLDALAESDSFVKENLSLMREDSEVSLETLLPQADEELDEAGRSDLFSTVGLLCIKLNKYLEFLCNHAETLASIPPKLQSLMEEIVRKVIYYIEPMMVAIVRPLLENVGQLVYPELALKMQDTFEKLKSLQAIDSLESVKILDSYLFCDWEEMLTQLAEKNIESFSKSLQAFVNSSDPESQDMMKRLYETRGTAFSPLMKELFDFEEPSHETDSKTTTIRKKRGRPSSSDSMLVEFTPKYRCWISNNGGSDCKLAIGFSPKEFVDGGEHNLPETVKMVQIGVSESSKEVLVQIFRDKLVLLGSDDRIYVLDLKSIMKGPDEQILSQAAARSCSLQPIPEPNESEWQRFTLGENSASLVRHSQHGSHTTTKLIWYNFRSISSQKENERLRITEAELTCPNGTMTFECKIMPKDTLLLAIKCQSSSKLGTEPSTPALRLSVFQYKQSCNQLQQDSEEVYPIDETYLSQLPYFLESFLASGLYFVEYRHQTFCVYHPHSCKPAMYIFGMYRRRFLAIGGTNCNRPGLYINDRYTANIQTRRSNKPGRPFGSGWNTKVDLKQEVILLKTFHWALSF